MELTYHECMTLLVLCYEKLDKLSPYMEQLDGQRRELLDIIDKLHVEQKRLASEDR